MLNDVHECTTNTMADRRISQLCSILLLDDIWSSKYSGCIVPDFPT